MLFKDGGILLGMSLCLEPYIIYRYRHDSARPAFSDCITLAEMPHMKIKTYALVRIDLQVFFHKPVDQDIYTTANIG